MKTKDGLKVTEIFGKLYHVKLEDGSTRLGTESEFIGDFESDVLENDKEEIPFRIGIDNASEGEDRTDIGELQMAQRGAHFLTPKYFQQVIDLLGLDQNASDWRLPTYEEFLDLYEDTNDLRIFGDGSFWCTSHTNLPLNFSSCFNFFYDDEISHKDKELYVLYVRDDKTQDSGFQVAPLSSIKKMNWFDAVDGAKIFDGGIHE
jgi:hypothetical protein